MTRPEERLVNPETDRPSRDLDQTAHIKMIEAKSFAYLSRGQRLGIFAAIGVLIFSSILLIAASKYWLMDQDLKVLGIDLLKMGLTASAAWTLVVLYGSSNSYERILREADSFLSIDITRAVGKYSKSVGAFDTDPLLERVSHQIIVRTENAAIYRFSVRDSEPIYFYCKISLSEVMLLFFLPAEHSDKCEQIYRVPIEYLKQNNISFAIEGVRPQLWLNSLPRLEVRVVRKTEPGFLFNAAARVDLCEKIVGDALAFTYSANPQIALSGDIGNCAPDDMRN